MDVDTAFLNSKADGEIYIELPPGWYKAGIQLTKEEVAILLRVLYSLKQAPRLWQNTLHKALKSLDFEPLIIDSCVYINKETKILVVTYIDDFLVLAK
jgi:hypothetical protein